MPIFDLYSKRKRALQRSGQPDVYQYERIPENVTNQITMILRDAIGNFEELWTGIINALAREYGDPSILLSKTYDRTRLDSQRSCLEFLMKQTDIDRKLDLIQLSFKVISQDSWKLYFQSLGFRDRFGIKIEPDDAIFELNYRLREGGVGYQYENGVMIRTDSQFVHTEITKKALSLLNSQQFSGAEDEFLSAHKHYRHSEHKDAIVDAGASFESTMKCICGTLGWGYDKGARASDLLKVLKEHRLFPDYLDKSFDQLLAVLKSGASRDTKQ